LPFKFSIRQFVPDLKIPAEKSLCLRAFVAKKSTRNISFKWRKSLAIIVFSCTIIFLFTNARRISSRHLSQNTWYLDKQTDSAGFFSADTLHFITPYPMWKIVIGDLGDTLDRHPKIQFGLFQKNRFAISFLVNGRNTGHYYTNRLDGMFSVNRKTKTMSLDFYLFDEAKGSDDIDDWIKGDSKKYRILEFTKTTLVLVKLKNE
jgi:hypothetical protein